ncbi:3-hydroxyacyl-CoA dehydrogenase/enoyl-CoA hydratase family protein [Pararhodobacter zhoushanensis]|uniref:3-hydroxyacyl-CoA dehydrogenase/enoyl-CoA hydratase family protein n=1 Tax=Pararhodobacter zhoushanensis TaxID=2479545 RepID=A0ABT3GXR0_9RHOB|nr:3-hydroxyacyl-CoA dehydrogenase/enoyl-CoA hydratase family protein [Pararhodobacter zhoushanensis]MCW1932329.1 3-hydroxyacyl-CoA dehydrogenase/enoyl-CoA hydratase family protein [Pararhodobacter zhoushanensis]
MQVYGAGDTGIKRAAVIGAGSMGGGIAAHFANAGIAVDLLDMKGGDSGCAPAEAGLARQLQIGGFMAPDAAQLVRVGNVEDHLDRLAQADWIIEAVIEKLDVKRALYGSIAPHLKADVIVSSNTSTIPRAALTEGMDPALAKRFAITHFFNPPRVMQLLEIICDPQADPAMVQRLHRASEVLLGKTVIDCRDTPGFIANRIGCFWMAAAAMEAQRLGLSVEQADAVHAGLGIPRTGVFGLFDLVGIDLVPNVWGSLLSTLPADDALRGYDITQDAVFTGLLAKGHLGRKTKAGFYRKAADGSREAYDLVTQTYRPEQKTTPVPRDPRALLAEDSASGAYAKAVLSAVLAYAQAHADEIASDPASVDIAMELGYSWKQGPFALAAKVGLIDAAPKRPRRASLDGAPVIRANDFATLHDLGDGVACFRARSKLNTFAPEVLALLGETLDAAGKDYTALVLGNDDARAFSAGADLSFFLDRLDLPGGMDTILGYVIGGQELFLKMRRLPVPVVAAIHGFTLGGGCEFQMHTSATVAHAEARIGVPETGVGLLPAWGGCTQLLARAAAAMLDASPTEHAARAFATIYAGEIAPSAAAGRAAGLLRPDDALVMFRPDLIATAKARALALVPGYSPPAPLAVAVAGREGAQALLAPLRDQRAMGALSDVDVHLAEVIIGVLTGGPDAQPGDTRNEEQLMALERAAFLELVQSAPSRARMEHMLATGKRLKN